MNYQTIFLLIFISTFFFMKIVAYAVSSSLNSSQTNKNKYSFFLFFVSPLFAPKTLRKNRIKEKSVIREISTRFFILSAAFILAFEFYTWIFQLTAWPTYAKAYALTVFVYLATAYMGVLGQALSLLTTEVPTDMHNHPYRSKSISEFWSMRWNSWIRDWLHLISKRIAPKSLFTRSILTFVISGIFHEVMFNLPYYLYKKESFFGTMMGYFIIQYICVIFDKKFLAAKSIILRKAFMWASIILPIPLFINKPFLYFFNF